MKYTDLADVFYGCEEIAPNDPAGTPASKWFFIKAGCGNTTPAATLPFGPVSAGPYSGGYPTGYLDHLPNSFARPARFREGRSLIGFSHLHQSGTGAIGYYYNYAVVTPRYEDSPFRRPPANENARPGYYSVYLEDIFCELTAGGRSAFHRYTFARQGGRLSVDLTNDGLRYPGLTPEKAAVLSVKLSDERTAEAQILAQGVRLYFRFSCSRPLSIDGDKLTSDALASPGTVSLTVTVSLTGFDRAAELESRLSFDEARQAADEAWERALSVIRIDTDDRAFAVRFYSNLYHSLVKPADWSGDSFIYGQDKPFLCDFITLWDMYKTEIPLLMMLFRGIGEKTVETLLCAGETLGFIPNAIGLSDQYKNHADQARLLGAYVLLTAYRYGVTRDAGRILRVIENDVFSPDKADFVRNGICASNTFILDMADACALAALLAEETGDIRLRDRLLPLAERWRDAYDANTGLLKRDSQYYEGTYLNYSFRPMVQMEERIALAGGKERFAALLDRFFGYGAPDTVQPTDPHDYAPVEAGMRLGRFEGFNNESDTETPFAYIYADRHDRTCEILHAGMTRMFSDGRGGIPGNNDTGALSSYYIFAALGLFPVAGQDLFLIGSPLVKCASLSLFNGNALRIRVERPSAGAIYVDRVSFNGKELTDRRVSAGELLKGGELRFCMRENADGSC